MTYAGTLISPLLVGRDDLLELAGRRLDEAGRGSGQMLLVAGEAGIGKSRLVEAIRDTAGERGFRGAAGYLAPQDRDVPAASLLDLARNALHKPALATLGGDLLEMREATADTEHARRRMLVVDIVERIRAILDQPTILVFEDLQWADDLSLEIIAELARSTRQEPLVIVGSYRSDEAPPGTSLRDWRSRLLTQRIAEELRLAPLDLAQTALVTTLILDTGLPAPREVVAAVYERTDGIPLHIEELLGAMSARARADGRAIREATVPETIEDAVLGRIALRTPEAQAVARAGAVIGRCFVPEVLAGIMDVPPQALDEPLQELLDNGVLTPPDPRGLYDFRHQLLRDAIYRSVPLRDRRRFHARAGEFGAQLEGQSEIHSSLHFERAGLRRQAFEAALAGARDAVALSAHREAFELYRRAVDNMPTDLGRVERAEILEAYGAEAASIEENEISERTTVAASDAYRAAGEPARAILAMAGIVSCWRRQGRPVTERLALLADLGAELDAMADSRDVQLARADVAVYLSITYTDARAIPEAREALATMRSIAVQIGDDDLAVIADWKGGVADFVAGDILGGLDEIGEAAGTAVRAGYESSGVSAYRDAATLAANAMHYGAADRWIAAGLRYADSIEQSHCAHVMSATSALVSWAGADWVEASERAQQAVADRGCLRAVAMARWSLGYVALGRGALDDASVQLRDAFRFGEASEEIELILPPMWGLAEVAIGGGDPDLAFTICREALERAVAVGERTLATPFVVTGVRAGLVTGRPAEATTWLDACVAYLDGLPGVADASLEHGRGLVALADGATGVARGHLEAAARGWDARGRIWEASAARLDLAHCLIRSSRYAEALPLAVEVRAVASQLDSRPLADRADALQRMARGHVPIDEPWRPLTTREYSVARLISEGLTNAEIADSLGIAPKTASSHVEHILAKLGASRRAEIATWATNVDRSPAPH